MNEPEYTPAEMMRQVEKLLGIGLETAHKAPEMGLERVGEAIDDQLPVPLTLAYKTWACEDFSDEWLERREAFSNEGELPFDEGLDDGEAQ